MTMALALPPDDATEPRTEPAVGGVRRAPTDDAALRALFERARHDDAAALETLCRLMRPRLYRAAWSVLRDRDDADDVAQEALVRAVTRHWLFVGRGSVGGWMTRIALNLAKNRRRDEARRGQIAAAALPAELIARGALAGEGVAPDDAVIGTAERYALLDAVASLSERQRDVVRLRAIGGLDFKAVGETLRISEDNARVTFAQAKKKLMDRLAPGGVR
jgi:RNA polymerase sigma-70 factor (ECF subfamily)